MGSVPLITSIVPACLPFCLCAAVALETNVGLKLCCLHLSWIYCRYRPERLIIMLPHYLPLVGASLIALAAAQDTVSLAITAKPTAGASKIISPSFAGFGIESSNLYSFTGGSSENQLTKNLLANLANYTGTPPHLRAEPQSGRPGKLSRRHVHYRSQVFRGHQSIPQQHSHHFRAEPCL